MINNYNNPPKTQTFHLSHLLRRRSLSLPYNCFKKACLEKRDKYQYTLTIGELLCHMCSDIERKQTQRFFHSL